MAKDWQARLADQLVRSMHEHPEDWEKDAYSGVVNTHLKMRVWSGGYPEDIEISWKGTTIIRECRRRRWWQRPLPRWRLRLHAAVSYARRNHDIAKMSVAIGDTLGPEEVVQTINRVVAHLNRLPFVRL